jgi:Flp pilus assembly pilin Flp
MNNCMGILSSLVLDRRAITSIEYAIIAGILVVTLVVGMNVLAGDLTSKLNSVAAGI